MDKVRTAILISGRGTNMVALAEAATAKDYPAEIVTVLSNRPDAAGILKAESLGIKATCIDHTDFKTRISFEQALHQYLKDQDVKLICCAGFMRVLTGWFVSRWDGRLLNIHPSLLPKYKGLHTHQRALDNGDIEHGCTVHFVTEELDSGAIIAQERMKILSNDTADTLARRLLIIENKLYPEALRTTAESLITTENL